MLLHKQKTIRELVCTIFWIDSRKGQKEAEGLKKKEKNQSKVAFYMKARENRSLLFIQ